MKSVWNYLQCNFCLMWRPAVTAKSILSLILALLPLVIWWKVMSCTEYNQHLFERNILAYSFKMGTMLQHVFEQFLTFRGPCIVSIFLLKFCNKMQHYTFYLFLENCIIRSTHDYLQHLVIAKPLLLPAAIAAGSSNGLASTRYCKDSRMCSWWWVEIPPETCRAVFQK